MVRYKKGEYKFQKKDTYWVGNLSKVILAYLEQLHKQLSEAKSYGIPNYYCKEQADLQGLDSCWHEDVDLDAAHKLRMTDIEELIYIFNDKNEPDITKYAFEIDTIVGEPINKLSSVSFDVKGREELDRYDKDDQEWHDRKRKGYELFGKIYQHGLDW